MIVLSEINREIIKAEVSQLYSVSSYLVHSRNGNGIKLEYYALINVLISCRRSLQSYDLSEPQIDEASIGYIFDVINGIFERIVRENPDATSYYLNILSKSDLNQPTSGSDESISTGDPFELDVDYIYVNTPLTATEPHPEEPPEKPDPPVVNPEPDPPEPDPDDNPTQILLDFDASTKVDDTYVTLFLYAESSSNNMTINWGDGTSDIYDSTRGGFTKNHLFKAGTKYTVTVTGLLQELLALAVLHAEYPGDEVPLKQIVWPSTVTNLKTLMLMGCDINIYSPPTYDLADGASSMEGIRFIVHPQQNCALSLWGSNHTYKYVGVDYGANGFSESIIHSILYFASQDINDYNGEDFTINLGHYNPVKGVFDITNNEEPGNNRVESLGNTTALECVAALEAKGWNVQYDNKP